jgi:hypothetical protein
MSRGRAGHGRGRKQTTDGAGGSGYADRPQVREQGDGLVVSRAPSSVRARKSLGPAVLLAPPEVIMECDRDAMEATR